ncbi:SAM-dependent MidA family methyltransferase [Aliiruegeria haliotis]|uniref:SAM-dependent MidA family methyltransferase n=1 Tax=Aliiruegeria haliotis TaxID=1280846 RepID=A0A2T0RL37_9RHOB|nr:SAM-dependent methyltransferase [Aliiruegeria haliotis]PRY21823.1 SAM-dependent MidA family methyltransferase [Aliiruegeria haliotis]
MTALKQLLIQRIAATGPMTLADFMGECLLHPSFGYYTNETVFGRRGDFTTAPEISQMFGELLGLLLAQVWMDQGQPSATLAEVGPGRGTLMSDVLQATRKVPGFAKAMQVHLVEASPQLRALQEEAVRGYGARWHNALSDLPDAPLFLLANEFLDALPVRQFRRDGTGWRECLVHAEGADLRFAFSEIVDVPAIAHRLVDTQPGEIVEFCPALSAAIGEISRRIARHGGLAVIIDYGDWRSRGDTFQAVQSHQPVDPLLAPGQADLTAHVDFEAVARAAAMAGATTSRMTSQGVLLERLGITARAQQIAERLPDKEALDSHIAAHQRLTHPQEMGSLFKTIAIYRPGTPPPPGFDP